MKGGQNLLFSLPITFLETPEEHEQDKRCLHEESDMTQSEEVELKEEDLLMADKVPLCRGSSNF